jgi:hypothetical protein
MVTLTSRSLRRSLALVLLAALPAFAEDDGLLRIRAYAAENGSDLTAAMQSGAVRIVYDSAGEYSIRQWNLPFPAPTAGDLPSVSAAADILDDYYEVAKAAAPGAIVPGTDILDAAKPSILAAGVPAWALTYSKGGRGYEFKSDGDLATAWASTREYMYASFRNSTAAGIIQIAEGVAAIAGDPALGASPVQWIPLSEYMRAHKDNPLVLAAGTELNSLSIFYTSWGGNLFNVALESTNCPYLSTERE